MDEKEVLVTVDGNDSSTKPLKVHVRVDFVKISDIDTKSQKFIAEVSIRLRWLDSSLKDVSAEQFLETPESSRFYPKLIVINLEDCKYDDLIWNFSPETEGGTVFVYRKIKGVFFENMELRTFPHDVQEISVIIASEAPSNRIELVPDSDLSTVNLHTFQDNQEWHLFQHVVLNSALAPGFNDRHEKTERSTVTAKCSVARKMKFFFYNAFLIMFFIICLSFTGFALAPIDVKFRLAGTLTLLLTSVAFKIALANSLPTISYLTLLDLYVLMGISYLCFNTALFAVISNFKDSTKTAYLVDQICFICLFLYQVSWHVFYITYFLTKTLSPKFKVRKEESDYLAQLTTAANVISKF